MGRPLARASPVLLLLLLLSSCVSATPVDDADPQGTLTTSGFEEATIDPARATGAGEAARVMMVFEPLLRLDPKTLRPVPAAARATPEVSADGLTYRLTLRDDGRYSDGSPVRASDFAYSFVRLCDPATRGLAGGASSYASLAFVIVGCAEWNRLDPAKDPPERRRAAKERLTRDGVRAISDKEIAFTLVEPAAYFPSILTMWIAVPVRESDVTRGGDRWTEPATYVGNGPFVLSTWRHQDRMIFTPNRFHRSPPRITTWTVRLAGPGDSPAVALNAYRHDELDVFVEQTGTPSPVASQIEADAGLRQEATRGTNSCTYAVTFNARRAPFDDASVRLAFAKALDRQAYVREVVDGLGAPASSLIPPGQPGHDPSDTVQAFDPAEARRLVAASRHAGSPALRSIVMPVGPNLFQRQRLDWMRGQWQQHLGIDVTVEKSDDPSYLTQLRRRDETIPHVNAWVWCADYPDQQNWLTLLLHSSSTFSGRRNAGFQDAEFDRLVRMADGEPDHARRDDLYRQAQRLVSKGASLVYLNHGACITLRKPWVRGVLDTPCDIEVGAAQRWEGVYIARKRK